jgi:hypothetical protein
MTSHDTIGVLVSEGNGERAVVIGGRTTKYRHQPIALNPLNAELNPICHLLALLEFHHILHVNRKLVKEKIECKEFKHGTVESNLWTPRIGTQRIE